MTRLVPLLLEALRLIARRATRPRSVPDATA
jgi:hypothetical protein